MPALMITTIPSFKHEPFLFLGGGGGGGRGLVHVLYGTCTHSGCWHTRVRLMGTLPSSKIRFCGIQEVTGAALI